MKKFFTLLLAFVSIQAFSQLDKNIAASHSETASGTLTTIDITLESDVWNCNGLTGSIQWDPAIAEYSSITDFGVLAVVGNPAMGINNFDIGDVESGYLTWEWFPTFTVGPSLNTGDLLFTVEFLAVGPSGTSTDIEFSDFPVELMWNEGGLTIGTFIGDDGSITIGGVNTTGCYLPEFWTTTTENTNGSVTHEAGAITMVGDNDLTGNGTSGLTCDGTEGNVSYCNTIPNDGMVTFHWDYDSDIENADSDAFGYCLNGVATQLASLDPPPFGTPFGDASFEVFQDDELCFVMSSENADLPNAPTVTITEFTAPPCELNTMTAELTQTEIVVCNGDATAALEVVTEFATEPVTYTWDVEGVEGSNPTGLTAGDYCVTVVDALEDTVELCHTITEAEVISFSAITQPDNGFGTGQALITVSGGVPSYDITWDTDPVQTGPIAVNLPSGITTFTVVDENGCVFVGEVDILFVGIEEIAGIESFDLYPNPSNGIINLNIEFNQDKTINVIVMNSVGQVVYNLGERQGSAIHEVIDLSNLNSGLYYLNMDVDGQRISRKISLK